MSGQSEIQNTGIIVLFGAAHNPRNVRATLAICVREAWYRQQQQMPTERVSVQMRPYTSDAFCFLVLIEIAESGILPHDVHSQSDTALLTHLTTEIVYLANDVVSLEKEIAQGDGQNLVIIARRERCPSLKEALEYMIERHNKAIATFQRLQAQLPWLEGKNDNAVRRYVRGLELWIRATMDWWMETGRYRTAYLAECAVNHS